MPTKTSLSTCWQLIEINVWVYSLDKVHGRLLLNKDNKLQGNKLVHYF